MSQNNDQTNMIPKEFTYHSKLKVCLEWIQQEMEDAKITEEDIMDPNSILLCELINKLSPNEKPIPKINRTRSFVAQKSNIRAFRRALGEFEIDDFDWNQLDSFLSKKPKARDQVLNALLKLRDKFLFGFDKSTTDQAFNSDSSVQNENLPSPNNSNSNLIDEKAKPKLLRSSKTQAQIPTRQHTEIIPKTKSFFESKRSHSIKMKNESKNESKNQSKNQSKNESKNQSKTNRQRRPKRILSMPKIMHKKKQQFIRIVEESENPIEIEELFQLDLIYISISQNQWNQFSSKQIQEEQNIEQNPKSEEIPQEISIENKVTNHIRKGKVNFQVNLINESKNNKIQNEQAVISVNKTSISITNSEGSRLFRIKWNPKLKVLTKDQNSSLFSIEFTSESKTVFDFNANNPFQREEIAQTITRFNNARMKNFKTEKFEQTEFQRENLPKKLSRRIFSQKKLTEQNILQNPDVYCPHFEKNGGVTFIIAVWLGDNFITGYLKIEPKRFKLGIKQDNKYSRLINQNYSSNFEISRIRKSDKILLIIPDISKNEKAVIQCETSQIAEIIFESFHFFSSKVKKKD